MTSEERDTIRTARDQATRVRLLETNTYEARRRRLASACAIGSTVSRDHQARLVMRMLAARGVK